MHGETADVLQAMHPLKAGADPLSSLPPLASDDVVFLLDCDNTVLDNDRVQDDLRTHLEQEFGARTE